MQIKETTRIAPRSILARHIELLKVFVRAAEMQHSLKNS